MNKISIKTAYDMFLHYGMSFWSDTTLRYYRNSLSYFFDYLEATFGCSPELLLISDLPDTILEDFVIYLRARDKYQNHPLLPAMSVSGSLKSNTVNSYMRAVKAFFNYLYDEKLTAVRFSEGVKLPKSDSDQIVPLLADEVRRIDAVFCGDHDLDLRNKCIIHLMLDAGLRQSEVLHLRAGDLIFASNTIVINQSKNKKSRVVLMAPVLKEMLLEYCKRTRPVSYLFIKSTENKPITSNVIYSIFRRIKRNTGITRLHPHLLRHTFATSYMIGGGNLESLRVLLGHSDYSVTRVYLHLSIQYTVTGADIYRLDPIFFKSGY